MALMKYDFSGWATKNDLRCSDGRTIRKDAFIENDGQIVPLVWNHQHSDAMNVLGHALLKNTSEGVYVYGTFNDTENGKVAKELVQHGDVKSLSIYANNLKQKGGDVLHGSIREVSLVLAGANPGAFIEEVIAHADNGDIIYEDDGIFWNNYKEEGLDLSHSEEQESENEPEEKSEPEEKEKKEMSENLQHAEENNKTVQDVLDELTEEQQNAVYAIIGAALEEAGVTVDDEDDEEGDSKMKHNVFENDNMNPEAVLSHSDEQNLIKNAIRMGSFRDAVEEAGFSDSIKYLAHKYADDYTEEYGIGNIGYLYPEAHLLNNPPDFIKRESAWVSTVMSGVHHTPFSRIKSMFADLTEDAARAKGYIKGNQKKNEVFGLLKRTTTPTTVYKKQKLDRDDIVDITDFNVVAWLKGEMRLMLDEEIARAILVGDGRDSSSDDKINEMCIRPIWSDSDLFTIKYDIATAGLNEAKKAKAVITGALKAKKQYQGSGNATMFTTEDILTEMLLLEDNNGRRIYTNESELATAMRVSKIVTSPILEGLTRVDSAAPTKTREFAALIVNLNDYNVGADKGGEVNMFDDFDINVNQQLYLIETRCSGALTKPFSAIAIDFVYDTPTTEGQ